MPVQFGDISFERMIQAVEAVRQRLLCVTALLQEAGIPYAVVGDNAVSAWVALVDKSATRNTPDVDILLRRSDLENAVIALEAGGFIHRHAVGVDSFLDNPDAKSRDSVRVWFAQEKSHADHECPLPDVEDVGKLAHPFRVLNLEPLVRMQLTQFRLLDHLRLRDLIDIGLVDASWPARFPASLATRLQSLLDDPHGYCESTVVPPLRRRGFRMICRMGIPARRLSLQQL